MNAIITIFPLLECIMEPIWAVDLVYTYIYYRWKKEKKSRILFWRVMMMRAGSTQCPLILFLQQWHSLFVYNARTLNRSSSVHLFHSILFSHFRQSSESFSLLLQSHPLFRVSFMYKKKTNLQRSMVTNVINYCYFDRRILNLPVTNHPSCPWTSLCNHYY